MEYALAQKALSILSVYSYFKLWKNREEIKTFKETKSN